MINVDTFLTTLYVMVDDFCQPHLPKKRPGPEASLSESEVITLAIFARWGRFYSERDFYRYAQSRLREAFPTLPDRSQFNRLVRYYVSRVEDVALHLALILDAREGAPYEALDTSAMLVRNAKRRGEGWLAGYADIGWSNSLGWYEGFCLLVSVDPTGVITGFGFASASTKDQPLAETFFALRSRPEPRLQSVGSAASGAYVVDKGFDGSLDYGARVICPPKRNGRKRRWPKRLQRWAASIRQIVESVYEKLHKVFGLRGERPHDMGGLRARLAASWARLAASYGTS